jgi:hypothetical protein
VVAANNRTNKKDKQTKKPQLGGTSLVASIKSVYHMDKQGVDYTGMGRFFWMQIIIKDNTAMKVILAHAPHKLTGPSSMGNQHQRYFNSIEQDVDPVDAFWTDLTRSIRKWRDVGESIILLAECNSDGRSHTMVHALMEIRKAIIEMSGTNAPPPTYNHGSVPIDGIFLSHNLPIVGGGYLPFGEDL